MKKFLKIASCIVFISVLFSCGSIANKQSAGGNNPSIVLNNQQTVVLNAESSESAPLASDKLQTYDEINRKYKALKLKYSKNREDFSSDEVFANFRNVKVGNIKEGILYRGASPIDNSMGRAKYVDKLIESVGIKFDVDLSDSEDKVKKHFKKKGFASNYFKSLYENGKVICLHMSTNYREQKYHDRIVKALTAMSKNEGPYYIHCIEGKNRTGFILAVIEGLMGASYEEMVKDHMITFANYYGITEESDKEKYDLIKARYIDSVLRYIADGDPYTGGGTIELRDLDWVNIMGRYLERNGMSDEDMHNLYDRLFSGEYREP